MQQYPQTSPACDDLNELFATAGVPYGCSFMGSTKSNLSVLGIHTWSQTSPGEKANLDVPDANALKHAFQTAGIRVMDSRDINQLAAYPTVGMVNRSVEPFGLLARRCTPWQAALRVEWKEQAAFGTSPQQAPQTDTVLATVLDVANDMGVGFALYNVGRPLLATKRPALLRALRIGRQ